MPRKNNRKPCPHCGDLIWFNSDACGKCAAARRDSGLTCSTCQAPMPATQRGGYCKDCRREYNREWRKKNPDKVRAANERHQQRRLRDPEYREKENARAREIYQSRLEEKREYGREWARRNSESRRATDVRTRFGLELDEYRAILARGCTICGSHYRMCMDHNHANGKVRDALCGPCNSTLGFMKDNPERLRAAARYLEAHLEPQNDQSGSNSNG